MRLGGLLAILVLLLFAAIQLAGSTNRQLLQSNGARVSIWDDTEPSADLGPRSPPPPAARTSSVETSPATPPSSPRNPPPANGLGDSTQASLSASPSLSSNVSSNGSRTTSPPRPPLQATGRLASVTVTEEPNYTAVAIPPKTRSCGAGCIAGSVVGSIVGAAIIAGAVCYAWKYRLQRRT